MVQVHGEVASAAGDGADLRCVAQHFGQRHQGDHRHAHAAHQAKILEWLRTVPGLIPRAAPGRVTVGLKLFNALFDVDFQLQMLNAVDAALPGDDRADFLVYANRLFDPVRTFEEKTGVAYGGPDLSDRNLAVLEQSLSSRLREPGEPGRPPLPISATGDIHSGRIAAEYLLRGASSFQMHTLFQLPSWMVLRGCVTGRSSCTEWSCCKSWQRADNGSRYGTTLPEHSRTGL